MIEWQIKARELVNCNCAWGCPCQFNALPTHGNCEAIAAYAIEKGHFGKTKLDGLNVVACMRWPGPIHEGGGRAFLIIDERASEEQRAALLSILAGENTEPGATIWNVFAATLAEVLEPVFKPIEIEVDVDARRGKVRVPGLVEVDGEPIRNPVTGAEHRARIDLPQGFEYSLAEMGSASGKATGPIPLEFKDTYGQFANIHLSHAGIVR